MESLRGMQDGEFLPELSQELPQTQEQIDPYFEQYVDQTIETQVTSTTEDTSNIKRKLSSRSQSSPSSLTTHKFGLRPTPSPPRLIIDHETGDIIESYPEQPVYLRTYQPLESELYTNQSLEPEFRNLEEDQFKNLYQEEKLEAYMQMPRQHNSHRPTIPPPHSHTASRVYFAPPEPTGAAMHHRQPSPVPSTSAGNNNSFKRALNKLHDAADTDIAIVTEPEGLEATTRGSGMRITATSAARANALLGNANQRKLTERPSMHSIARQVAANSAPKSTSLEPNNKQQANTSKRRKIFAPNIEDFDLYGLCYNFRLLLVILFSSIIIYLLCIPLNSSCTKFRPTHTYVSIILASVNLICIIIFTLFWYCSGVTRTLYANLSSSAFIITIYSVLVALNFTLAIIFFFVNTCHSQELVNTPVTNNPSLVYLHQDASHLPLQLLKHQHLSLTEPLPIYELREKRELEASHSEIEFGLKLERQVRSNLDDGDEPRDGKELEATEEIEDTNSGLDLDSDPQVIPDSIGNEQAKVTTPTDDDHLSSDDLGPYAHQFTMSPLEAGWDYSKRQFQNIKRDFVHFLKTYDLRFIGTLHAFCAICLQYLAMKVAVVRSFFCVPMKAYT